MNKPFDLEAAKRGEPIETADGRPMTFIAHVPEALTFQQVVVLGADGQLRAYSPQGHADHSGAALRMAAKTEWVNLYRNAIAGIYTCGSYPNRAEADLSGTSSRIACVEVPAQ